MIDEDKLQANSAAVGGHLLARLRELAAKHDIIGDVRGSGLMVGIELVSVRSTKVRDCAGRGRDCLGLGRAGGGVAPLGRAAAESIHN